MVGTNCIYPNNKLFIIMFLAVLITASPILTNHTRGRSYSNKMKKMHTVQDGLRNMKWNGGKHGFLANTISDSTISAEEQQQKEIKNKGAHFFLADTTKHGSKTKTRSSGSLGIRSTDLGVRTKRQDHQKDVRKGTTLSLDRAVQKFRYDKGKGAERQRLNKKTQEKRNAVRQLKSSKQMTELSSVSGKKVIANARATKLYPLSNEESSITEDDTDMTTVDLHPHSKTVETNAATDNEATEQITAETITVGNSETIEKELANGLEIREDISDDSSVVNGGMIEKIDSIPDVKIDRTDDTRRRPNRGADNRVPFANDESAEDAVKNNAVKSSGKFGNRPITIHGKLLDTITKQNRNSLPLDKQHPGKLQNETLEVRVVDVVVVQEALEQENQTIFDVESIAFIVAISSFAVLVLLAGMLIVKYRSEVKILLYTRLGVDLGSNKQREHRKQYDVFIAYSQDNADWVNGTLVKRLENLEPPYTLQVISRDVMRGGSINENIALKIEKCAATVVVLSKGFADSGWCLLTVYNAEKAQTKDYTHRIIPIIMPEFDMDALDFKAQLMLKTNVLLASGDRLFWDRLIYALPAPLKKFRRPSRVSTTTLKAQSLAQWAEDRLSEPDESAEVY